MSINEFTDINEIEEDTQKDQYLTFPIGNENYGIEIRNVTEIIKLQVIIEMPELPDYIKGIINLRGKIIPVMDVRTRFKKPLREYDDRTCVIVVKIDQLSIGLIVDSVSEVISINDKDVEKLPSIGKIGNKYIKGIGKVGSEIKLLLDCNKLLNDEEIEDLNNIK